MMKTLINLLIIYFVATALVSCADYIPREVKSEEQPETGQSLLLTAPDGTVFEVAIPPGSQTVIDSIEVIGVQAVEEAISVVGDGDDIPPLNENLIPRDNDPVELGIDVDQLLGNNRWGWLENIDREDVEALIEDICPPWH